MSAADEKLKAIVGLLKKGVAPPPETVRSFLLWFGAERRGFRWIRHIRWKLKNHGLVTVPDFEYAYIDSQIGFQRSAGDESTSSDEQDATSQDPTYRVGRLDSANKTPVSVKPDASLQQAITLMLTHDFSQLPVMTSPRDVKGMISWKSIGSRLALKQSCTAVRDCMETPRIVSSEDSLFSALSEVTNHDHVLVQAADKTICGIITATDFNEQFRKLAEPFLLVGEIERGIRRVLHGKFLARELEEAKGPGDDSRKIEAVADLNFGEYIRLIEPEARWKKLRIEIDRVEFISRLNKIREIRNDVMHFDPDGLDDSDLKLLREFALFLKRLRDVGAV